MTMGGNNFEVVTPKVEVVEDDNFSTLESIEGSLGQVEALIAKYGESTDLGKIKANLEARKEEKQAQLN
ncbi:MAG: hypothetical protein WCG20_03770 [bacterium]